MELQTGMDVVWHVDKWERLLGRKVSAQERMMDAVEG